MAEDSNSSKPSLLIDDIGTVRAVKSCSATKHDCESILCMKAKYIHWYQKKKKKNVRADVGVHAFNFSSLESGAGTPL